MRAARGVFVQGAQILQHRLGAVSAGVPAKGFATVRGAAAQTFNGQLQLMPASVPTLLIPPGSPTAKADAAANFGQSLRDLENSHDLFARITQFETLADQGEFNATRFCELRDSLLARAYKEPNDELVFVVNHVGATAFGLKAKTPEEAFAQATKSQSAIYGAGTAPIRTYLGELESMDAAKGGKTHLPLAREVADRHLIWGVWSVLFAQQHRMPKDQFSAATRPYLASISSGSPTDCGDDGARPGLRSQAEAENAIHALGSYFDKLDAALQGSCTVFARSGQPPA